MNRTQTLERLRLLGASGGAIFAALTLVAYLIHSGPSSGDGVTVVEYYSTHDATTLGAAALVGIAVACFILFAETFADHLPSRALGVAGAAATAALYLAAVGCWEILGEIYGGVDLANVPSEGYSNAHVIQVIGNGAAHMGNFAAAAYVGATATAILVVAVSWRPLAWLGIAIATFRLISAVIELASNSHWSDVVSIAGFLAFLAWVFSASVWLVVATHRGYKTAPRAAA
jgi:hypothetical protein